MNFKTGTLHHHGHQIFAYVMDIAFYRANHHGAHWFSTSFRQQRLENRHATFHGIGRQQYLWHKQDTVAEVDTYNGHTINQSLAKHFFCGPTAVKQDGGALFYLFFQAIVEIVMHLQHQIFVG